MRKTPFFSRQLALCESMHWKSWAGAYAVASYLIHCDAEYHAIRHAAGLLDVSPLFKYRMRGPDAASCLARIMVRDIQRLPVGRVAYCCWCDDHGKVIDDGTVMRRGEDDFFITSADPCFSWFSRFVGNQRVVLEDVTERIAALAIQGPYSRAVLQEVCDADLSGLRFFRTTEGYVAGARVWISRTGYTGDLGYEIWMDDTHALAVWDALMAAGEAYALRPAGLDALDMCRIESGLILKDVDYYNALHALVDHRTSSPFELSLGWTVELDREQFCGQTALQREKTHGAPWSLVGLDIDWEETERLYARYGLPPEVPTQAWRTSVPLYRDRDRQCQIGYATSGTWSPILKKNIALATVRTGYARPGTQTRIEMTVEHTRHAVAATICAPRFFNPKRKTAVQGRAA